MSLVLLRSGWTRAAIAGGLTALMLAGSMGEASAQYYRRNRGPSGAAVAAGVVGGLALGALAAGAARRPYYDPYYAPVPVYADPPPPPRCWYEREDVWNGYTYVPRRVRVCE